jgi:hypothetical protein
VKKLSVFIVSITLAFLFGCSEQGKDTAESQQSGQQQAAPATLPPGHPPMGNAAAPAANGPQFQGKVDKVTHVQGYTYLQLNVDGKEVWIAAAPVNAKTGDTVSWSGGSTMRNFTSKTLRRSFEEIIFTDKVTVVN